MNEEKRELGDVDYPIRGLPIRLLPKMALSILVGELQGYGNRLSVAHKKALGALLKGYTRMAFRDELRWGNSGRDDIRPLQGRWAVALDTGCGKSMSIAAWCAALYRFPGIGEGPGVAIAASRVEALCDLKRKLVGLGIPADRIGLHHSYKYDPALAHEPPSGYASEPATTNHDGKQFMLITHSRVRGERGLSDCNTFQSKPRRLLIYDESLLVSDARAVPENTLRADVLWLSTQYGRCQESQDLLWWLQDSTRIIADELAAQRDAGASPQRLCLPPLGMPELGRLRRFLAHHPELSAVRGLVDMLGRPLRVVYAKDRAEAVVVFDIAVPEELENIIVLDASYPVRLLESMDPTVKDARKSWAQGCRSSRIKRYSRVTVHHLVAAGGRGAVLADIKGRREDRKRNRAICDVVASIPSEQAVIVFGFKDRDGVSQLDVLKGDLRASGVDLSATVRVGGVDRPRFIWLTWGMETGLSEYSYAENVILAGVLHRDRIEVAGAAVGQLQDLVAPVSGETLSDIVASEVAHSVYQALSRGACRVVENGEARPMNAWIIHRSTELRGLLQRLMPGVRFQEWTPEDVSLGNKVMRTLVGLVAVLEALPASEMSISTRRLKQLMGLDESAKSTFTRALKALPDGAPWRHTGRSLIRV